MDVNILRDLSLWNARIEYHYTLTCTLEQTMPLLTVTIFPLSQIQQYPRTVNSHVLKTCCIRFVGYNYFALSLYILGEAFWCLWRDNRLTQCRQVDKAKYYPGILALLNLRIGMLVLTSRCKSDKW